MEGICNVVPSSARYSGAVSLGIRRRTDGLLCNWSVHPGIIALNTSTFIGYKNKKLPGAITATLGFLSPSILIIVLIAAFMINYASLPVVNHAFAGIRICVCALILDAVLKLGKKSIVDKSSVIIFLVVVGLAAFTNISTILLVIAAGIAGYLIYYVMGSKRA